MTNDEKNRIRKMRLAGKDYKTIAQAMSMTVNSIKVFCHRQGLSDIDLSTMSEEKNGLCPFCGKEIIQRDKSKPRKFCSDKCRMTWWSQHRELQNRKAFYPTHCAGCGKEFLSYGNQGRKYCSRTCYMHSRFGLKGNSDDQGTV